MPATGGSGFEAGLPTMAQASQHVHDVAAQIDGQLRALIQHLDPLMTTWLGAASMSFHQLRERYLHDARMLNQALTGIGEGLQSSHQNYAATEESNQQTISSLAGGLGSLRLG